MPKISVVMTVYNNEKYFPVAVKSVLDQTYTNFELVIVDDGSTDNTPQIADEFARQDSRVKVIHQENQWIYAGFNNGIKEATGDYIYILNSDDKFYDNKCLEVLNGLVEKYNPDVIFTDVIMNYLDIYGQVICKKILGGGIKEERVYNGCEQVRTSWGNFISKKLVGNQANLYKVDIMKKYKFRNDVYAADVMYNIQIADDIKCVVECSQPIYCFNIYCSDGMNASQGKYYGYEHKMFNEIFHMQKELFEKWNMWHKHKDVIYSQRLMKLSEELKAYNAKKCPLSFEERTQKIFFEVLDNVIYECGVLSGRKEELEARVLSGCRELFLSFVPDENSDIRFVYDMLVSLLRYEKTDEDMQAIKNGVYNKNNKFNIGESFYKKLEIE